MTLNSSQRTAIETDEGPLMVVAGPGSGKTTTLTLRVAYLIREGLVEADKILAITFTQKATKEILERINALQALGPTRPTITTFHGLAYQIVKEYGDRLGLPDQWTILSTSEQRERVQTILKELPECSFKVRDALQAISRFKTQGQPNPGAIEIQTLVQRYQKALAEENHLDFDDLLIQAVTLLMKDQEVQREIQNRFESILVDEYQDTSPLQAELIHLLTKDPRQLFVIGDPDQSIYSFRGADLNNFLNFTERYPETKTIPLEINYRCPKSIMEAASAMIQNNTARLNKPIVAHKEASPTIQYASFATAWQEAAFIIKKVQQLMGGADHLSTHNLEDSGELMGEHPLNEMVVLYRLNSVGRFLAKQFEEAGIPYQMVGDRGFFDRKEIREFIERVHEMHQDAKDQPLPKEHLSEHLRRLMRDWHLKEHYDDGTTRGARKWDHLLQLLNIAMAYNAQPLGRAFQSLYEHATLSQEDDYWNEKRQAVTLMTVHAAKGLEFPIVFMAGLEEGIFPYLKHTESSEHLEEERRLFYVGMTRTQEALYLSSARERRLHGETLEAERSRFIDEIPAELINTQFVESRRSKKVEEEKSPQMELF